MPCGPRYLTNQAMCSKRREDTQNGGPAFTVDHWAARWVGDGGLALVEHPLPIHLDLLQVNHSTLPGTPVEAHGLAGDLVHQLH